MQELDAVILIKYFLLNKDFGISEYCKRRIYLSTRQEEKNITVSSILLYEKTELNFKNFKWWRYDFCRPHAQNMFLASKAFAQKRRELCQKTNIIMINAVLIFLHKSLLFYRTQ